MYIFIQMLFFSIVMLVGFLGGTPSNPNEGYSV